MTSRQTLACLLACLALAGCAAGPEGEALETQASVAQRAASGEELLERARMIAAAKGFGEQPGADAAARAALAQASAARKRESAPHGQTSQASALAQDDESLADVNERIRLAALRVRAERMAARDIAAPASGAGPQEASAPNDARDIFRRARERYRDDANAADRAQPGPGHRALPAFGTLNTALPALPGPAPPASHLMAATGDKPSAMGAFAASHTPVARPEP